MADVTEKTVQRLFKLTVEKCPDGSFSKERKQKLATTLKKRSRRISHGKVGMHNLWIHLQSSVGDPKHGIKPGPSFEALSENWACPICEALKDQFIKKELD